MEITSREVNYAIWRYFQEEGLALSAYALDKETGVSGDDAEFKKVVEPGDLVKYLLKGRELATLERETPLPSPKELAAEVSGPEKLPEEPVAVLPGATAADYGGALALGTEQSGVELHQGESVQKLDAPFPVTCVGWSKNLAVGDLMGNLRVWTPTGEIVGVYGPAQAEAPLVTVRWSPDGSLIAATDVNNIVSVWDIKCPTPKVILEVAKDGNTLADVEWIDAKTYAVIKPGEIAVYKVTLPTEPAVQFRGHSRPITVLKFDARSKLLASGGDDAVVCIWQARSQAPLKVIRDTFSGPVMALAWIPGNLAVGADASHIGSKLLIGAADGSVVLADLNEPDVVVWRAQVPDVILLMSISSRSDKVAVASTDNMVRVFTIGKSSEPTHTYTAVDPQAVVWADDKLVVATRDSTLIWQVGTTTSP